VLCRNRAADDGDDRRPYVQVDAAQHPLSPNDLRNPDRQREPTQQDVRIAM
jgi:hypothetical protein